MIDVIEVDPPADEDRPPTRRRTGLLVAAAALAAVGGSVAAPSLLGGGSGDDLVRSVEATPSTTSAIPPTTLPAGPEATVSAEPGAVDAEGVDAPTSTNATFVEIEREAVDGGPAGEVDGAANGVDLVPARRERRDGSTTAPTAPTSTASAPTVDSTPDATSGAGIDVADAGDAGGSSTAQGAPPADTTPAVATTVPTTETVSSSAPATSIVPDEVADAAGAGSGGGDVGDAPTSRPPEASIIGSIAFPSLGLDFTLREGIQQSTIDLGPTHWPGTAMPGEVGNVVIAGHRTSYGGPFRQLNELEVGDVVSFDRGDGPIDYVVAGSEIVGPDALWIVDPTDTPTATLFSCHPLGSTAQRIVVHLELAE